MLAKNISGRKIKVEYGFLTRRRRELLVPGQIIEIDQTDYNYLQKLGVFSMNEMVIVQPEVVENKMVQAKKAVEEYIKK